MKILCKLGIHTLTRWHPDPRDTKYDRRYCMKCGKPERRKVV